ncbi:hypothetical protein [Enterococcus sp. DIV1314a]|uniref:hypothetical protein n=1 Tax=Enterococcus sp. DIV1314a TaxID=2774660 RepID=UPI003F6835E5
MDPFVYYDKKRNSQRMDTLAPTPFTRLAEVTTAIHQRLRKIIEYDLQKESLLRERNVRVAA